MNQPSLSGFDWGSLDSETRAVVQETTARLHELERRTGEAIIEIGRGLIDTKGRLEHGQFGLWLDAEFGWSWQTANNFMNVAERFGDKFQTVGNFQARALYALASGNVPEFIREEFIAKAEAGEPVRHKEVKERIVEEKRRLALVDVDSGEIMDEPELDFEYVDPADPASFIAPVPTHRPTPISPAVHDVAPAAVSFSNGLIDAQAPATIAKTLAECKFRLLRAKSAINEFPSDVFVKYGGTPDSERSLDTIILESQALLDSAISIRNQLLAGQKVRAIR